MSHTVTFFVGVGIFFFTITCLAIFDIARKEFGSTGKKFMWAAVSLIPFIGPIFYFAIGFWKGKKPEKDLPAGDIKKI